MARKPKPWYRTARKYWCIESNGEPIVLARGPKEATRAKAMKAYHQLMGADANPEPVVAGLRVLDVCKLYCTHAEKNLAPLTAEFYRRHLGSFAIFCGKKPVAEVGPGDVENWFDRHRRAAKPGEKRRPWGQSTRSGAAAAVIRAFRWAAKQKKIPVNPMIGIEKPAVLTREEILTDEQARMIRDSIRPGDPFGDLLDFLRATGCRPSEAYKVEAKHFIAEARVVEFKSKTSAKVGHKRTIHLTGAIAARVAELAKRHPKGPILRAYPWSGAADEPQLWHEDNFAKASAETIALQPPWTRFSVKTRFARLRVKLGLGPEATAESYRHMFATDALEKNVPIATVAELMGHKTTTMVMRVYSKLAARRKHLSDAVELIRGGQEGSP